MDLLVASLNYSSWSARPFIALHHAGIAPRVHTVGLAVDADWKQQIERWSGAGKVPVLRDGDLVIHESIAICEYIAELRPEAELWPKDRGARARARAVSAEMHAGFGALRETLVTNVRMRVKGYQPTGAVAADIQRVQNIWRDALQRSGGPFLFGNFSVADCMFAPVATRFRTYDVEVSNECRSYMQTLFLAPSVKHWLDQTADAPDIPKYDAISASRGSILQ